MLDWAAFLTDSRPELRALFNHVLPTTFALLAEQLHPQVTPLNRGTRRWKHGIASAGPVQPLSVAEHPGKRCTPCKTEKSATLRERAVKLFCTNVSCNGNSCSRELELGSYFVHCVEKSDLMATSCSLRNPKTCKQCLTRSQSGHMGSLRATLHPNSLLS